MESRNSRLVLEQSHESITGHVKPHEPFEEFNYAALDGETDAQEEPQNPRLKALVELVKPIFAILDRGDKPQGIAIRMQAMKYLLGIGDQPALATHLGVTRAAISKVAIEIAEEFGIELHHMRSPETREKFSELTKQRHQKAAEKKARSLAIHQEFARKAEIRKAMTLNPQILQ